MNSPLGLPGLPRPETHLLDDTRITMPTSADDELSGSFESPPETAAEPIEQPPLIVVEGFCCATNSLVWGDYRSWLDKGEHHWRSSRLDAEADFGAAAGSETSETSRNRKYKPRRVIFAPIGPVSSLHDRACELFYALRGGQIDYGEAHAREHGHARFGRCYERGLLGPEGWNAERPAHFLAHSFGGPTILKLQQLLREGFFDAALGVQPKAKDAPGAAAVRSPDADALVLSVTAVSSPFRGTQVVYTLGANPRPYPSVRRFSAGDLLAKAIHLGAFLDLGPDFMSDAWGFSRRRRVKRSAALGVRGDGALGDGADGDEEAAHSEPQFEGLRGFLRQLRRSDWAEGRDCAPWDCTIAVREEEERSPSWGIVAAPGARTWYRSYAAYMTMPAPASTSATTKAGNHSDLESQHAQVPPLPHHIPKPSASFMSPFALTARLMGKYDFDQLEPRPSFWRPPEQRQAPSPALLSERLAALEQKGTGPVEHPWHAIRRLSSQGDVTPKAKTHAKQKPARLVQEPLLGGLEPSVANLGSSACSTPTAWSAVATDPLSAAGKHIHAVGDGRSSTQEPLEQWYANDGVVPLASQYHPGACQPGHCVHEPGLPGPTPRDLAVRERRDAQRADALALAAAAGARSSTETLRPPRVAPMMQREGSGAPRPRIWERGADEEATAGSNVPIVGRLAAWAARLTHKATHSLLDPARDAHFQPASEGGATSWSPPKSPSASPLLAPSPDTSSASVPLPAPNVWHTYVLRDTSHTALCPLWIGTEQQRIFWAGMGEWLAAVDAASQRPQGREGHDLLV